MKTFLFMTLLTFIVTKVSAQSLSYSAAATSFAVGSTLLVASPFAENIDQKVIFDDCVDFYVSGVVSDELQSLIEKLRDDPELMNLTDDQLISLIMDQMNSEY